jgi:predicted PurR-regulated permease PerM
MKLLKTSDSEVEVTISNRTVLRIIGVVALAVILFLAARASMGALTWIGTSIFLALALNAPVHWLASKLPKGKGKKDRRGLATAVSIVVIVAALAGFIAAIVPPVAKQTGTFIKTVPSLVKDVKDENSTIGSFVRRYNLEGQVDKFSQQLSERIGDIGGSAISTVSKIGSSIFATLTILVLTIMMLFEGPKWVELGYRVIPARKRAHAKNLASKMLRVIQGYVNGQVTLAALASLLIVPMLFIMDVSYPFALMVVVFVCGLIPMVGHTIGAIICTIVALFTSLPAALVVLGYYILYQQIENYTLQPKIQANSTDMSPLLVFVAVLFGASFGGLLGALVAIPVMGCIRILVIDYLEQRDILSTAEVEAVTKPSTKKA